MLLPPVARTVGYLELISISRDFCHTFLVNHISLYRTNITRILGPKELLTAARDELVLCCIELIGCLAIITVYSSPLEVSHIKAVIFCGQFQCVHFNEG